MKRAVSISLGSSSRNKSVDINLLGETIRMERIGTDGDMQKATDLYTELDGKVDAFGVGGALLGIMVGNKWTPMYSVQSLIKNVRQTPVVDGTGLKMTLEKKVASVINNSLPGYVKEKKAFVAVALDRWGSAEAFMNDGYECVFGDLMFALGLGLPVRKRSTLINLANMLLPVLNRLPFSLLYPTGEKQNQRQPRFSEFFEWATVVAGDCHYLWRHMPERLPDRVIVTNTTTPADQDFFRSAGIKNLITTTPIIDGRSFGTNMIEAAILAALGRKDPVDYARPGNYFNLMEEMLEKIPLTPQVKEL